MTQYTLVRHTGYSVGGKEAFKHAVEERAVTTAKERSIVAKAGGLLFESYNGAHDRAFNENYSKEHHGINPAAQGKFVKRKGFDEEIYIP